MLNTTSILDQLNRQFGWVSRLANRTLGNDGFLQVTTVSPAGCMAPPPGSSSPIPPPRILTGPAATRIGSGAERGDCVPAWVPLSTITGSMAGCQGEGPAWGLAQLSLLCPPLFPQPLQVLSKAPNLEDPSAPPDTQVTVQLFDSEPLSLTVPGDISWEDPRFMEMVAEQALQHYKENAM